jgi:phosphoribosylformylglycinamidine synthase
MACRGISEACRALKTPVTGGNVSLYNETRGDDGSARPIHPTPVVGMVGLVEDIRRVVGLGWCEVGDSVVLLGVPPEELEDDRVGLAGSSYQQLVNGVLAGRPPRVDLALEQAVQSLLRQAIGQGLIASAHDSSDGGLAVAVAECCIASGLGVALDLSSFRGSVQRLLFGEGGARVVVSVKQTSLEAWERLVLSTPACPVTPLGVVQQDARLLWRLADCDALDQSVESLRRSHEDALPRRLGVAERGAEL